MPKFFTSAAALILLLHFNLFAQSQKEVELKTSVGSLYGTLEVPVNPTNTVCLIIAGSGPTDRDGNSFMGLTTNTYKMLAKGLADNKLASLRYDKRGTGKSMDAMIPYNRLRFESYVNDAIGWVKELRDVYHFNKIIVVGHSEGAQIAAIVANRIKVDKVVLLSGMGRPFEDLIREQLKSNVVLNESTLKEANIIIDSLKADKTVANVSPPLMQLFFPAMQPYLSSWMKYSPEQELNTVKVPVLIIQGDQDIQVSVKDADRLAIADPKAKKEIIHNMNHVLKIVTDRDDNQKSYNDGNRPLAPGLVSKIVGFIN